MELSATNFRKNLFQTLDKALQGETVEVVYKGARIQVTALGGSKLARAVRRPTLLVEPDAIVQAEAPNTNGPDQNWLEDFTKL